MAFFVTETITVTTAASGGATATTVGAYNGFVHAIVYTIDGTNPYSNSVVIAVTGLTTGITIWSQTLATNASIQIYPRAATYSIAGVASLFTTGAAFAVTDRIPVVNEQIQVAITSGGNTKLGKFQFIIGD